MKLVIFEIRCQSTPESRAPAKIIARVYAAPRPVFPRPFPGY